MLTKSTNEPMKYQGKGTDGSLVIGSKSVCGKQLLDFSQLPMMASVTDPDEPPMSPEKKASFIRDIEQAYRVHYDLKKFRHDKIDSQKKNCYFATERK